MDSVKTWAGGGVEGTDVMEMYLPMVLGGSSFVCFSCSEWEEMK